MHKISKVSIVFMVAASSCIHAQLISALRYNRRSTRNTKWVTASCSQCVGITTGSVPAATAGYVIDLGWIGNGWYLRALSSSRSSSRSSRRSSSARYYSCSSSKSIKHIVTRLICSRCCSRSSICSRNNCCS